jgi:hypothetical protein
MRPLRAHHPENYGRSLGWRRLPVELRLRRAAAQFMKFRTRRQLR